MKCVHRNWSHIAPIQNSTGQHMLSVCVYTNETDCTCQQVVFKTVPFCFNISVPDSPHEPEPEPYEPMPPRLIPLDEVSIP